MIKYKDLLNRQKEELKKCKISEEEFNKEYKSLYDSLSTWDKILCFMAQDEQSSVHLVSIRTNSKLEYPLELQYLCTKTNQKTIYNTPNENIL